MQLIIYILFALIIALEPPGEFTVLAANGVNLREKPCISSKILAKLEFGRVVLSEASNEPKLNFSKIYISDTINNIHGYWLPCLDKQTNQRGYIFSPYIYQNVHVKQIRTDKEYRLMREGQVCGDLNFHPSLNFYKLIQSNSKYELKEIKLNISLSKVFSSGKNLNLEQQDESIYLNPDLKEESIFIIGSNTDLFNGQLNSVANSTKEKFFQFNSSPLESNGLMFNENSLVYSLSSVKLRDENSVVLNEKAIIHLFIRSKETNTPMINVNLTELANRARNQDWVSENQILEISNVLDLNNDGFMDFIFKQKTMTDTTAACKNYILFMSNIEDDLVKMELKSSLFECGC